MNEWILAPSSILLHPKIARVAAMGYEMATLQTSLPQHDFDDFGLIWRLPDTPPEEGRFYPAALSGHLYPDRFEAANVETRPSHRRRGLAHTLYVAAILLFPERKLRSCGMHEPPVRAIYERLLDEFSDRVQFLRGG